jgi:hypothetical protein
MAAPTEVTYGYLLACEDRGRRAPVRRGRADEQAGFLSQGISDRYEFWTGTQGLFVRPAIAASGEAASLPRKTAVSRTTVECVEQTRRPGLTGLFNSSNALPPPQSCTP